MLLGPLGMICLVAVLYLAVRLAQPPPGGSPLKVVHGMQAVWLLMLRGLGPQGGPLPARGRGHSIQAGRAGMRR